MNKFLAIVIALFGLITSGILVAIAVEAAAMTFEQRVRDFVAAPWTRSLTDAAMLR